MDPSREKIEDLISNYGLEEKEATALWHLNRAEELVFELLEADEQEREERGFGSEFTAWVRDQSRVVQHFVALRRELAVRVLRRNYPKGWGRGIATEAEEDDS